MPLASPKNILHWTTKIRNFTYVVVYRQCYKFLIFQWHLKKLSSPLPAFKTFYHLPFSFQKILTDPPKPSYTHPLSSCGIHIECSLIRTQVYFSKPLNGWFTKYFPYIIWSWCIRIRRSLISKSENILPATKYPSIHTFGCSLNGKAIRVPGKITD